MLVEPLAPTPHCPVRHAHNLGCFPPLQLSGSRLQYHFLCLHHPLHFRGRDLLLENIHVDQLFPPACSKRTFHLSIGADNSHTNDSGIRNSKASNNVFATIAIAKRGMTR